MMSRTHRLLKLGILFSGLLALASFWLVGAALAGTSPRGPLYVPNEYIIQVKTGTSYSAVKQAAATLGGTIVKDLPLPNTYLMKIGSSTGRPSKSKTPSPWVITQIQPNKLRHPSAIPNDEFWNRQWDMEAIGCPAAWDTVKGDSAVRVAVVDTGVAYDHPDLAVRCIPGYDFVDNDSDPYDLGGHGTHVAGTIGAQGDNGIGITGVCWEGVRIMPVRVLGPQGGTDAQIIQGLDYALTHGANVVNMSLGGPAGFGDEPLHAKCAQLVNAGIVVVAAAGNDASDVGTPAAFPEVICVAATGPDDTIAVYSSYGPGYEVDIAAPGGDGTKGGEDGMIYSTVVTYADEEGTPPATLGYAAYQGTSMACPHVAGAAALLISQGVPSKDVRARLQDTARPPAGIFDRRKFGAGILDLAAALTKASITIVSPAKGSTTGTNPAFKIKLRGFEDLSAFNTIKIYFDYADDGDGIPDNPSEPPIIDGSSLYLYANAGRTEINFTWNQLTGSALAPGRHYVYVEGDPLSGGDPVFDWCTFEVASLSVKPGMYMYALPMAVDTRSVSPGDILPSADFSPNNPLRAVLRHYITLAGGYASYYPNSTTDIAWVNPVFSGLPTGGATYDLVKIDDATGTVLDRRSDQYGYPVGTGFWLILSEPCPVSDAYPTLEEMTTWDGYVFDQALGCKIRMYRGWNMVGNPYTHPIPLNGALVSYQGVTKSLQDAAAAGWISTVVYGYRNTGTTGYEQIGLSQMLQPYGGYWFWALVGGTEPWTALKLHLMP